jgi:uncharacterized LabA/DUF88 family protein
MKKSAPTQNNYAFIDSQNLNLGVRSSGWILDYRKFRQYLRQKYNIQTAFMCIGFMPSNNKLYAQLQSAGFILIFKPITELQNGKVKGNVDADLVLHAMIEFNNYHKAIIVSNDGDFLCLVQYLAENDKLLKLMTPNSRYSKLYSGYEKYISNINNLRSNLEYKKPGVAFDRSLRPAWLS